LSRHQIILDQIDKNGFGIEIGPSHNPIAPKKAGYNVEIIDHASKEILKNKYDNNDLVISKIEDVDFVWSGENYADLTGKKHHYDWIIASHLVEHTPDLISFLNNCDSILNDTGVLALVIPDKRYCFDHFRPITGLSGIIDSHFSKNKIHTPGTVAEYFMNVVRKSDQLAWEQNTTGDYDFCHTMAETKTALSTVINAGLYLDVHAWCFVPNSLRLIIEDLFSLDLIKLREAKFLETINGEFYVTLSRTGGGPGITRKEILHNIEKELINGSISDYKKNVSIPSGPVFPQASGNVAKKSPKQPPAWRVFLAQYQFFQFLAKLTRPIRSFFSVQR
jgi:predicted SAM-dependent methyltransferase